ncbi:MAG TPA: hypothetical protein VKZ18_17840 [Polyangia bacterium]|nr:hypothetical protein [Polyangia bacterium]
MRRNGWLERDLIGDTSAHECASRLWLATAFKAAVRDRRVAALSVLLVAGGLAAGSSAWLVAIPLAYAARFLLGLLRGRAHLEAVLAARTLPIDLPSALSFSDDGAKRLIERLERARWATANAAGAGPACNAFALTGLLEEVPGLERAAVVLAARVEYLGRFLDSTTLTVLRNEVVRLEQEREKESDEAARAGLQRLITRCQEQVETLQALTARKATALRTADEILRTLEQIPARIVSLQLARFDSCDVRLADADAHTQAVVEGFAALERATRTSDVGAAPQ